MDGDGKNKPKESFSSGCICTRLSMNISFRFLFLVVACSFSLCCIDDNSCGVVGDNENLLTAIAGAFFSEAFSENGNDDE